LTVSERFLLRFNLPNDAADEARRGVLNEFETIQAERVERLRETCAEEIRSLRGKRVLFLGDSITSDNLGYRPSVSRAAELLATDGSISGATTASLLPLARERIGEASYDLISVMLGANDSVTLSEEGRNQVSLDEYAANLDRILGWAKAGGATVLLLAVTSVSEERFARSFASEGKSQSNQNVSLYNHRLRELAKTHGIPLVEHTWLTDDQLIEKDGIHLSPLGQERLAKTWLRAASKFIKENRK
jgi:lysophospholipase L1-like esterase